VRLVVGEFDAESYDELFDNINEIPWQDYIEKGANLKVNARHVNGVLYSVPNIQSVTQKAIYTKLGKIYNSKVITGAIKYSIEVHVHKKHVVVSIDTSGRPLHMRGYRVLNPEAALRETLAAALVIYSSWQGDWKLYDPMCGSGTICVEAAMFARNMPPGGNRSFAAEAFPWWDSNIWSEARQRCQDEVNRDINLEILGSDKDKRVLRMAQTHARRAGVTGDIKFFEKDATKINITDPHGHIISNPPYGIRIGDKERIPTLYRDFFSALPDSWSWHIISSREEVEQWANRKANKKRKLYNGKLACRYYEFFRRKADNVDGAKKKVQTSTFANDKKTKR
jgi:putative N6-adenine-specific DNA methylase